SQTFLPPPPYNRTHDLRSRKHRRVEHHCDNLSPESLALVRLLQIPEVQEDLDGRGAIGVELVPDEEIGYLLFDRQAGDQVHRKVEGEEVVRQEAEGRRVPGVDAGDG